tara:strand:- start:475 stop:693 length:219 start_codon:yes stop_codon:yes gene_type:complete
MAVIESTQDIVILIGAIGGLLAGFCAGMRLSKCTLIKCWGMEIHRKVKSPTINRTGSQLSMSDNDSDLVVSV